MKELVQLKKAEKMEVHSRYAWGKNGELLGDMMTELTPFISYVGFDPEHINNFKYIFPVTYVKDNPFNALQQFGIRSDIFRLDTYDCPITEMIFYWIVPKYILANNEYFTEKEKKDIWYMSMMHDKDLMLGRLIEDKDKVPLKIDRPGKITQCMLGPGYTFGTLPSDGSDELVPVEIQLDNNDILICWTHIWYNK